jgi:pimeloyl-ACP methyl ester carboxylesterase
MTVIALGAHEIDYERTGAAAGTAPPLLLIMGMSGTALHWGEAFLSELRPAFDVIAYDHRGVGASSPLEGPITIREMAEDAAGLLAALSIERAHVVGISMGGMVAQELALAHPEAVETLTLGCTYCGGEGSALTSPAVMQRLAEGMLSGDRERALRTAFEVNVSRAAEQANPELFEQSISIAARRAVAVPVIMAQIQACVAHDAYERLPALEMPSLVIHGTADEILPVQNAPVIASRIPGARLEIFEGAGHLFFWEQPQRSGALVREHAGVASASPARA